MAAAVAGVGRGGGGNVDARSSFLEIAVISTFIFLLLCFLSIVILDLKIWSIVLSPNSPFWFRISAHASS